MSTYSWQNTLCLAAAVGFFLGAFVGTSAALGILEQRQEEQRAMMETQIVISRLCLRPKSEDEIKFCEEHGF